MKKENKFQVVCTWPFSSIYDIYGVNNVGFMFTYSIVPLIGKLNRKQYSTVLDVSVQTEVA